MLLASAPSIPGQYFFLPIFDDEIMFRRQKPVERNIALGSRVLRQPSFFSANSA